MSLAWVYFGSKLAPNPKRYPQGLAMAEFFVNSFALFMWWRVFEACSQIGYLTDVGWLGSKSQQKRYSDILVLLTSISYQPRYYIYIYISILFANRVTRTYGTMHQKNIIIYHMNLLRMSSSRRVVLLHEWWFVVQKRDYMDDHH